MKINTLGSARKKIALIALLLVPLVSGADIVPLVSPEWRSDKELTLSVMIHLDSPKGVGSVSAKVRLALNFDETGVIQLGNKVVKLTPTNGASGPLMVFDVYREDRLVFHSSVPFEGDAEVKAKVDPEETGLSLVDISAFRINRP